MDVTPSAVTGGEWIVHPPKGPGPRKKRIKHTAFALHYASSTEMLLVALRALYLPQTGLSKSSYGLPRGPLRSNRR